MTEKKLENMVETIEASKEVITTDGENKSVENPFIKIKVLNQEGNEIHYRLKMFSNLEKLKKSYSEQIGVPCSSLRFVFDGKRLSDTDTPNSLEMEDGDLIEVYQEQTGGVNIV
jgi:small ubiquitin-related modifier